MSDPSLSKFTTEELRRLYKKALDDARNAPKSSPDAPSSAWANRSNDAGRYREELQRRFVDLDQD